VQKAIQHLRNVSLFDLVRRQWRSSILHNRYKIFKDFVSRRNLSRNNTHEDPPVSKREAEPGEELSAGLAHSLLFFCQQLDSYCQSHGIRNLYFLSREGYHLRELYNIFQHRDSNQARVTTHYLEVSRQSTYLPSLGPLDSEDFSSLLTAYKATSARSFLISIGLASFVALILQAAGISEEEADHILEDFKQSSLFQKIRGSALFQKAYEDERLSQRIALGSYLKTVAEKDLSRFPEGKCTIHLVDVGWQGSIQDNLERFCLNGGLQGLSFEGIYLGLLKQKPNSSSGRKTGLLFDYSHKRKAYGARTFSENRALFEIILHATHGAVAKYAMNASGNGIAVHEPFHEQDMIRVFVEAPMRQVTKKFRALFLENKQLGMADRNREAVKAHAKLVFDPSPESSAWFEKITHFENFGVIKQTAFNICERKFWLRGKIKWTAYYLLLGRFPTHSFWPVVTMRAMTLWPLSAIYTNLMLWRARYDAFRKARPCAPKCL
jgi:hypothetical protein